MSTVPTPGEESPAAPAVTRTPKKAAVSAWLGSALEYYDFFIYAQAAALVFPVVFFPSDNPQVAVVASLATFGVGYVARPIGAFALGHWGDTHGRKNMLVLCMLLMGVSTFLIALLPTYGQIGVLAPVLLVVLRLVQGFAVGGEISGASTMVMEHSPFGRRGFFTSFTLQGVQGGQLLAAAVFLPLAVVLPEEDFQSWGWRIPFLLSAVVIIVGLVVRRKVEETPAFQANEASGEVPRAPIVQVVSENGMDMVRVIGMALMNVVPLTATVFGATYATSEAYGNGFSTATFLWISVVGNIVAMMLIPLIGSLSDRIGRRPCIIVGALGSTAMAYAYLYAISVANVPLAFVFAMLMWGSVYQGYNAVFPSYYQELFPTRTRVTGFAVSQNIGTMFTALLPSFFAFVAPPGSDVPLIVGSMVFGIGIVVAISAWTSRETHRVALDDLGDPTAVPMDRAEYERVRNGEREQTAATV